MAQVDVTAAQAQAVMTALGQTGTSNLIVYSAVVNPGTGQSEIVNFLILHATTTDIVFYPKKTDGTYILESTLTTAYPNSIKVNAVG